MNQALHLLLKALSDPDEHLDVTKSRQLMNLKAFDPLKPLYLTRDETAEVDDHMISYRIYFPHEDASMAAKIDRGTERRQSVLYPVIFYIHGGGFSTESVESYNKICWNLSRRTGHIVAAIDYPLAPEHRFPVQIQECYSLAKALYQNQTVIPVDPEKFIIMGDSAGGNLTAAVCQMARDKKEFLPKRQILIYPCVNNDYSENSPFPSVMENGRDYLLTRLNMVDYLDFYQGKAEDRQNPYFAPLMAEDYSGLPDALVITGEFDPLRDEGEEYARRMREAGVSVEHHRISDAIHGFFLLPTHYPSVRETYEYINEFLSEVDSSVSNEENQLENA
ncbi:MAG: alpha/beta hydrolase [Lachnospiraceae bacterium]|nr:alpha/beta hydrolase [Lachnospiraceae bacterium]